MTPTSPDKPGSPEQPATPASAAPRSHLSDPPSSGRLDGGQEVDIWWGAYSIRAMVPTFVLCAILSLSIILLAAILWDEAHPQIIWHLAMLMVIAVWIYALTRCGYLMAALNYRLTTHHLFRDRGFRQPADGSIALAEVRQVLVERNAWEHLLGIGKIRVLADKHAPLILEGLRHPEVIAEEIRRGIERARKRG